MKLYTKAEKESYIKAWECSNLTAKEFCVGQGIKPTTFYSWTRKMKDSKPKEFIQIKRKTLPNTFSTIVLESKGHKITLAQGFNKDDLKNLLGILGVLNVS